MHGKTVLVTGVTGFVGRHVASDLLRHGYDVRGTVRNPETADVGSLRMLAAQHGREFAIAAASLTADTGWAAATDGVAMVAHVASPAPKEPPTHEDELIVPAVEGTRRVLSAAARAGAARVVVTSSIDAVRSGHDLSDGRTIGEETWSIIDRSGAYAKSKTLAERAAWQAAEEHGIDLVTLCPGLILGPMTGGAPNVSVDIVRQLLTRELPLLPHLGFNVVDARDVAVAHRLALEMPQAGGKRYILATEPIWLADIARVLAETFDRRGFRVSHRGLPSLAVRAGALLNPAMRLALPLLDTPAAVSAARVHSELGWTPRPWQDAVISAGESLIAAGIATPR